MNRSGPIFNSLLKLAVILSLASRALSQAPPKYDPATETTFKGIVEELKLVPPTGGKPIVYLVLKSNPDGGQIFLCPKKFLDDVGVVFKVDDPIEITGSHIKQNGADLTLAREVVKVNGGETLTLRFKDGRPAW
ncbi:MAG TPA: hypothetical protein VFA67_02345 [Candidatus Sulfotelmatobacter sp.]|nr:hypothetical protein [Candidatus Sulfotelmatobacter sp.]